VVVIGVMVKEWRGKLENSAARCSERCWSLGKPTTESWVEWGKPLANRLRFSTRHCVLFTSFLISIIRSQVNQGSYSCPGMEDVVKASVMVKEGELRRK
jgi:hypothetical protein